MHTVRLNIQINNKNIFIVTLFIIFGIIFGSLYAYLDNQNIENSITINSPQVNNLTYSDEINNIFNVFNKSIRINDFINDYENNDCKILSFEEKSIFQNEININIYSNKKFIDECELILINDYQSYIDNKKNNAINSIKKESFFLEPNFPSSKNIGVSLEQLNFVISRLVGNPEISIKKRKIVTSNIRIIMLKKIASGAFVGLLIGLFLILKK